MSSSRILLIVGACLSGCVAGPAAFQERLLATLPEDSHSVVPVSFSHDGRSAAWVERGKEGCRAVCGEWKGKPYGVVC
jgi:hypothetical protein